MSLEVIKKINIDLHDSKYIQVNAKQYDRSSRFILVTCYNNGTVFPINNVNSFAFIRGRKPDELGIFNQCKITDDGKILVELTEQMLAVAGTCYVDLIILDNEPVETDNNPIIENTGEIIIIDNDYIAATMTFCINVIEAALDNTEIESSYEFNALNDLMIKATEDYSYVMSACKISEDNAKSSEIKAKESEDNAKISEYNASLSEKNAKESEINAKASEDNAKVSETNAKTSEDNAKGHEDKTRNLVSIANEKSEEASRYALNASESASTASNKALEAIDSALLSKSYAVGDTGVRVGEDEDNSKYYYIQAKAVSNSIGGSFSPMGTIKFEELQSVEQESGYVYHISDSFVTDDSFKCGAGISLTAGTNIYYTVDGYWDYFIDNNLIVKDDNEGNVFIECTYDTIATTEEVNALNQMITDLRARLEELESQTSIGVTE